MGSLCAKIIAIIVVGVVVGIIAPLSLYSHFTIINGELFNLVMILFILIFSSTIGLIRVKQKNISFVLYLSYFLIFGIAQLLALIIDTEFPFSISIKLKANFLNVAVLLCFFIGENLVLSFRKGGENLNLPKARNVLHEKNRPYLSALMWISFLLSLSGLLMMIYAKRIPIHQLFSCEVRTFYRLKGNWALLNLGSWMFSLNLIANYTSLIRRKYIIFTICAGLSLLAVFIFGKRAYLLFFIGPLVYYYIDKTSLDFRRTVLLIVLGIAFVFSLGIFHLFRWQQERTLKNLIKQLANRKTYSFILCDPKSEFNYRLRTFQAVEAFPKRHKWLYGNTCRTIFLFWLPSGVSKRIKEDTMYKFADIVKGTTTAFSERASIHPTFTGDCYINFGYFFWIPALIWGIAFGLSHIKARKSFFGDVLMGSTSVYFLIFFFRGAIYKPFFTVLRSALYISLIIILIDFGRYEPK